MASFTEGTLAVVLYGERFVELSESGVTLQDICEAFGVPYGEGVYVKNKESGQPVATLPFEPVFTPSSSSANGPDNGLVDINDGEPVMLELHCPVAGNNVSAARQMGVEGAAVKREEGIDSGDGVAVVDVDADARSILIPAGDGGNDSSSETAVDVALRELAKLGAVELLSADTPQHIAQMPAYNAKEAPGLLRRIIYPASQYSPFRARRDPLQGSSAVNASSARPQSPQPQDALNVRHSPNTRLAGFTSFQKEGAPYATPLDYYGADMTSEEDLYAAVGCTHHGSTPDGAGEEEAQVSAILMRQRPDLTPLSNEELNAFFT